MENSYNYTKVDISSYYPSDLLGQDAKDNSINSVSYNNQIGQSDMDNNTSQSRQKEYNNLQGQNGVFSGLGNILSSLLQSLNLNGGNLSQMLGANLGDNAGILGLLKTLASNNSKTQTQGTNNQPFDLSKLFKQNSKNSEKEKECEKEEKTSHIIRTFKKINE